MQVDKGVWVEMGGFDWGRRIFEAHQQNFSQGPIDIKDSPAIADYLFWKIYSRMDFVFLFNRSLYKK